MAGPRSAGDLERWLKEVALGEHAEAFAASGIDWDVLADLSEQDFKELGLSLGDRKRLLKAIAALNDAPPREAEIAVPEVREAPAPPTESDNAERRHITVIFVDLVGSTPLSERLDPEELRNVLRAYYQASADVVAAYDGHIAKYLGDGILVYFGYPRAHEDDAARAVRAGLGIIEALRAVNERLETAHGLGLHARIAAHTGLVVVGKMATGSVRDNEAIGETLNVAARLQSLAQPDTLVIGPATQRLIEGLFSFEELGTRELKGLSGPVRIYRVIAEAETVNRFDARVLKGLTPLVGRSAELEMLRQRWAQACDGEMRCVLLIGDPGIGKSRTLRAFRDGLADEPHERITLHCSPYHRNSAFWPVLEWLRRALRIDPKNYTDDDGDKLEAELHSLALDVKEFAPIFAAFLELPTTGRHEVVDPSSASFKRRTLNALVSVIAAMARRQPALLVLEDAHWVDPSTLELMRLVQERLVAARLLLLITARPQFKPEWTYPQIVQVNLDRLSRRDRVAMVERLTEGKPLPRAVLDQIVTKTDGIPLFVEELTKTVLESDLLRDAGDRYELIGPERAIAIPDTLQGSLLARLDRVEPKAKELAQIGAAIGREFGRDLLAAISGWSSGALEAVLATLVAAEIVQPAPGSVQAGGAFVFRHALIQETAYQSLLLARRRQHHSAIAEALEHRFPEIVETQPEVVAQHLTSADLPDRAIDYWLRAGERAAARFAHEEARAHLRHGLDLVNGLPGGDSVRSRRALLILLVLGYAEIRIDGRQAMQTFRAAAEISRREKLPAELARAALGFEEAELFLGASSKASVALLEEALMAIGVEETVDRCRILSRLGRALNSIGAFDRAIEATRHAMPLARRLNDERSLVDSLMCELTSDNAHPISAPQFQDRRDRLQEVASITDSLGQRDLISYVNARCHPLYLEIGDVNGFEGTLRRYEQNMQDGQSHLDGWAAASARAMRAILYGEFNSAERCANQARDFAENVQAEFPLGVYGMQIFTIRREQGRLAEVAPLLKRFVDQNPGDSAWRPGLMLIASDLGFEPQARKILIEMTDSGLVLPMDGKRTVTLSYIAEVCARLGDFQRSEQVYDLLLPYRDIAIVVPIVTLCCGSAARYLGMLASTLGCWGSAEEHFEAALAMDERMKAAPWLAYSQHEYARAMITRGRGIDFARVKELRAAATETAKRLGMVALLHRLRAGLPSS